LLEEFVLPRFSRGLSFEFSPRPPFQKAPSEVFVTPGGRHGVLPQFGAVSQSARWYVEPTAVIPLEAS
jgi:hypothetical protein